jgi:PhnB protein
MRNSKKEEEKTMTSKPARVPQPAITPYMTIKDAADAIEFYKKAFGAVETMRLAEPGGRIGHAEIMIGGAPIMLSDEYPDLDALGPKSRGGSTVGIHLYVEDVDEVFARAVAEGATAVRPVKDEFYGDRSCKLVDPFGHVWYVSTRKEELSADEVTRRFDDLMKQ